VHVSVESPQAGITVLRLVGDLGMNEVATFRPTLETAVQKAQHGVIVLLSELNFMDSSGVAVLIEGLKWSQRRSLPYILADLTPGVQMVMELARLQNFFTIAADLETAIALIPNAS
jgi:anti-sigma B factor antagonist